MTGDVRVHPFQRRGHVERALRVGGPVLGGLRGSWLVIRYWRGQMPFGGRR